MGKCRGVAGYPSGGAVVVFENYSREGRGHPVGVLDNCGDGVV